ncbi:MAG: chromosome segregation protein SMC [Lachnospiraceae bacterium]|nr:chromosome segregation protein SMC [Lachnospiraceae bacterium]
MYLKSIEVHGFKSFANKINFEFHNGITGIVGPNGSGKSNVADAMRWVLGQQSAKQLRGSSMQDVIFSGTELRKPMGFAYVSITLDNADHVLSKDYEEITVSRRVYRSGESEYLINGIPCRLKEINEMFYDTGIGKEGYSIIGQGQIDKILSGKPEERRELFDEAAGIVKFKRRKALSIKKLETEHANLLRVSDIISVLENQVGPLKEQSDIARQYLEKKEQLKHLDINIFLLDTERTKKQLNEYGEKLETAAQALSEAKDSDEKSRQEFDTLNQTLQELETAIEQKLKALSESGRLKEKLEGEIKLSHERIHSAQKSIEEHQNQKDTLLGRRELQEGEKKRLTEKSGTLQQELLKLKEEDAGRKAELSAIQKQIEELNNSISANNAEVMNLVKNRALVKEDIGRFDTMLEQMKLRRADVQSQLIRTKSEEAEHIKTMALMEEEQEALKREIAEKERELSEREKGLVSFKHKLEETDNELQEAQLHYHRQSSKLDSLKGISERYEGYNNSIRRVMEQKDKGNNRIIGVVADILKVEKEYETAIEVALGGNIQNIITEDDRTAKSMIRFLKENKYGRATFMPLTSVRGRGEYKRPEVRDEKGFLGIASELVQADRRYDEVISQLLGEILIVDTYDNARNMERKYNELLRVVTLEGEYFTPGGAVAGGAFQKNSTNLLGRKREIESLKESIAAAKEKVDRANQAIEDIKAERTKERNRIEEMRDELQELTIKQNTATVNMEAAQDRRKEFMTSFDELRLMSDDLDRQVTDIAKNKEGIHDQIVKSEEREKELNQLTAELGQKLSVLRDEESRHILKSSEFDRHLSRVTSDYEHAGADVLRADAEIARLTEELAALEEKIAQEQEEIKRRENDIEEIEKTLAASDEHKDDSEEEIKKAQQERDALKIRQKELLKQRDELQSRITSFDKEVDRLTMQKERLEEEEEKQISFMWQEYEITLSRAQEYRDEKLTDAASIRRGITSLRNEIKALGDVNVNAIEQYKEIMTEYERLKKQHDDLIQAEKDLEAIIEELDTAMRRQFEEKFADIAKEFDKVFKELFDGGKGTVELSENEDILEAGIRVIAQPPGKKLQNMMMLSGGEKALTAIALLFAIQNLKPSPFCLLDEIEAALDEPNVVRFAGYLHKLTKHTQFIVITHRRGTMEKADRLYGITMQEKGVSALVSVSLIDKELED